MIKDLWVGYANADERTAYPVLEDGKTLDELVPKNDALGQHLIRTMSRWGDGSGDLAVLSGQLTEAVRREAAKQPL